MSAKGQAFVEENSPYKGSTYLIHLRMGILENETHHHRLFTGDQKFAALCRVSVKTLQRARERMIQDGFLRVVKVATGRHVAEYEFLFPGIAGQSDQPSEESETGEIGGHDGEIGGHLEPNSRTSTESLPIYGKERESKETKSSAEGDGREPRKTRIEAQFDVAWAAYPRKEARKAALAAFTARVRVGVRSSDLVDAARNYAGARVGWERDRIMLGATFFGPNERYVDFLPGGAGLGPTSIRPRVTEADVEAALAFLLDLFSLPPEAVARPLENALADRLFDRYTRTQLGRMSERDIRSVLAAMAYGPRGETA